MARQGNIFDDKPQRNTLGFDSAKAQRERVTELPGHRLLVPRVYYHERVCDCGARLRTYKQVGSDVIPDDAPWLDMSTLGNAGANAATAEIHVCKGAKP